jgi:hypothetical protein
MSSASRTRILNPRLRLIDGKPRFSYSIYALYSAGVTAFIALAM